MKRWNVIIGILLIAALLLFNVSVAEETVQQTIVVPTDSYLAVQKGTTYPFSFFILHRGELFGGRQLRKIELLTDDGKIIKTSLDSFEYPVQQLGDYQTATKQCYLMFDQEGQFELERIELIFQDDTVETYPIGRLMVEVFDEDDSALLNTYPAACVTGNAEMMVCNYVKNQEDVVSVDLFIGTLAPYEIREIPSLYATENEEQVQKNFSYEIEFDSQEWPVVYRIILPRIHVTTADGTSYPVFAKAAAGCGVVNVQEETVWESLSVWQAQWDFEAEKIADEM